MNQLYSVEQLFSNFSRLTRVVKQLSRNDSGAFPYAHEAITTRGNGLIFSYARLRGIAIHCTCRCYAAGSILGGAFTGFSQVRNCHNNPQHSAQPAFYRENSHPACHLREMASSTCTKSGHLPVDSLHLIEN